MDTAFSKRDWAYAGLSHPAGIAVARRVKEPSLRPGNKVVLVGDESAGAVGQFLGKLALDSKVNFRFEWERGQLLERWTTPERVERLLALCPSLLVFMMPTKLKSVPAIEEKLKLIVASAKTVPVRWITPLVLSDESLALLCALSGAKIQSLDGSKIDVHRSPTGAPSARGFAGMAGAIWGWLR